MSKTQEPDEKLCIAVAKAAAKALEDWDFTGPVEQAYQAYMAEVAAAKQPDDLFYLSWSGPHPSLHFSLIDCAGEEIIIVEVDLFTFLDKQYDHSEPDQEGAIQALERVTERLKVSFKERFGREPTQTPRD